MEPADPVAKKKKKSKRPSSRKVQAAEDALDTNINTMDTPIALIMKDDSLNSTKERIKKTKKEKKKKPKKDKMERLSMSVNDLSGANAYAGGGGLGESLQRLNLSSGDLDGPELDCLKTVAELSVETFQLAPIPGAEDLTVGIDIHRERKKKKDKKEKSSSKLLKKKQQRRQSTGGLGNLEGQLSQLFLQNKFKNTYDAIANAEDLQTVADVSVASFHPVKFEDEDRHQIDLMRSGAKKKKDKLSSKRRSTKEEPEERLRGNRSRTRDIPIPEEEEEKDDSALPSKAEMKERRRTSTKASKPEKKRRSKSISHLSLEAHLQSMSDLKYEGISMPTKNTQNPYGAITADDIESVADLSVGTFQPMNEKALRARAGSRRGASLLGPMRGWKRKPGGCYYIRESCGQSSAASTGCKAKLF